jgi:hypothetical protein
LIGEDLRNSAPTDVFYEDALFIFGWFATLSVESAGKLDCCEVVVTLFFQRTAAERILRPDAIIVRV